MPFNPLSISGCTLWLKGDAGCYHVANTTPCANGDTCVQWQDQSGSGHHAVTNATNPVYVTGVSPSLLPVLDFGPNFSLITSLTLAAPYTVFVVYLVNSTFNNHRAIQGSNNWLIGPRSGFHMHYAGGFVTGTGMAVVLNAFVRAYVTNSGTASHAVFDGTDYTTSTSPVTAPGTVGLAAAGSVSAEGLGQGSTPGYIGEVIIYNSVLSPTDLAAVDTYLTRWQNGPVAAGGILRSLALDGLGGAYMRDPLGA